MVTDIVENGGEPINIAWVINYNVRISLCLFHLICSVYLLDLFLEQLS